MREKYDKHGASNHKLYRVYWAIKSRCYKKNDAQYKDYGGRQIMVCDEWINDFRAFYDWAIRSGYQEGLTIDRINNDGNYEPKNCRWTTRKEQQRNMRSNRIVEFRGENRPLSEWCEILNINRNTAEKRIRNGYDINDVFYSGKFKTGAKRKTATLKNDKLWD